MIEAGRTVVGNQTSNQTDSDDHASASESDYLAPAFDLLRRLPTAPAPDEGTAQLKPVRHSGRHQVWRTAHPFDPDLTVRLIVWFPPAKNAAGVTLLAGEKTIGDVWYSSVSTRADAAIERWMMGQEGDDDG